MICGRCSSLTGRFPAVTCGPAALSSRRMFKSSVVAGTFQWGDFIGNRIDTSDCSHQVGHHSPYQLPRAAMTRGHDWGDSNSTRVVSDLEAGDLRPRYWQPVPSEGGLGASGPGLSPSLGDSLEIIGVPWLETQHRDLCSCAHMCSACVQVCPKSPFCKDTRRMGPGADPETVLTKRLQQPCFQIHHIPGYGDQDFNM